MRGWKRRLDVLRLPMARLTNDELENAMAVDTSTPLLRGVQELIERYQIEALTAAGDEAAKTTERLGAATRLAAMEDLKRGIEEWRVRGVKRVRGN